MKFTEYITEASKYELQLYGIIQSLNKDCMEFIQELRKSGKNPLWRGTNKSRTKSIVKVTPRQDRYPKDMPEFMHDMIDEQFKAKFGWKPRSTGVFVTGRKSDAGSYGATYMFFPVGKYSYLYNPDVSDLYSEVDGESMSGYSDYSDWINSYVDEWEDSWYYEYGEGSSGGEYHYDGIETGETDHVDAQHAAAEAEGVDVEDLNQSLFEWAPEISLEDFIREKREERESELENFFDSTIKNYRNDNLGLAIKKNVEIMFQCKTFYLINNSFIDSVQKYVIDGEKLDFDPKQSKFGFEKVPMTRRNIQKQKRHPDEDRYPWEFADGQVSKLGLMSQHKKYMDMLSKSHKGKQQKLSRKR